MARIVLFFLFIIGVCLDVKSNNLKNYNCAYDSTIIAKMNELKDKLDKQEQLLNSNLKENQLEQKEFFLGKYVSEAGILISALGIVFAVFSIGIPIYIYNVEKRLQKSKRRLQQELVKIRNDAQKTINEEVQSVSRFCKTAKSKVEESFKSIYSVNKSSGIEIKDSERMRVEEQVKRIEEDISATDSQKAVARFYDNFYKNRFYECKQIYQNIIKQYKDNIAISEIDRLDYYIGICHYRLGEYKDALLFFEKYHQINNKDVKCSYYLANCYFKDKDYSKAIRLYKECLEQDLIKADNKILDQVYSGIGLSYMEIGDYEAALESLDKALQTEEDIDDYINIARVYIRKAERDSLVGNKLISQKEYKNAIIKLKECLKKDISSDNNNKKKIAIYIMIGESYWALRNGTDALIYLKKVIDLDENNLTAWLNLLQIYNADDSYDTKEDRKSYLLRLSKIKSIIN